MRLVARQARNLRIAGSNPAPATNLFQTAVAYRVYVIQNRDGKFYIGLSDDVGRRINQHNAGDSRWTRAKGPWTLVWQSGELSLSEARKLENRLKRQKGGLGLFHLVGVRPSSHSFPTRRSSDLVQIPPPQPIFFKPRWLIAFTSFRTARENF